MPQTTTSGRVALGVRQPQDLNAIVFEHVSLAFDEHVVLKDLSFTVPKGDMRIMFGASGAGKSVILKLALGLLRPDEGTILVNGLRVDEMSELDLLKMRADIGMVFQENALFDSLTVAQNVGFRLQEERELTEEQVDARIDEVLGFVGLREFADRMPAALSGGQRRRVGIARAMASKPRLLLFAAYAATIGLPASGRSRPSASLRITDVPAPLAPNRMRMSPFGTVKLRSLSTT